MSEQQEHTIEDQVKDLLGEDNNMVPPVESDDTPEAEEQEEQISDSDNPIPEDVNNAYNAYKELGIEFPEDFKLQGITKEELQGKAKELMTPKQEEDEDPFLTEYKEAKKAGLSHEDFMKQKSERNELLSMDAHNGLKRVFQSMANENGERLYDDNTIEEHLEKLTAIEKDQQWNATKQQLQAQKQPVKQSDGIQTKAHEYNESTLPKLAENISSEFENEIVGLPFGESEKKEFNNEFKELLQIDAKSEPKTVYKSKVLDVMNNAKELYELMYVRKMLKSGGLQKYISSEKEKAIAAALEKAGIEPQRKSGTDGTPLPPQKPDDFI